MSQLIFYIAFLIIFFIELKHTFQSISYYNNIKYPLKRMIYYYSILGSLMYIAININSIYSNIIDLSYKYFKIDSLKGFIFKVSIFLLVYFFVQITIYFLLNIFNFYKLLKTNNKIFIGFQSIIVAICKSLTTIMIVFTLVIIYNNSIVNNNKIDIFNEIAVYKKLDNLIINKSFEKNENNSRMANKTITYYNGITLEEGIESNEDIAKKANEITYMTTTDREKARNLYIWIGNNIEYDYLKAEKVLNNDNSKKSGAIEAFETKTGICLDYACLFVAMAKEVGLKSRIISGKGYDGEAYVSHAWNEVYLDEEKKWIPIDPTFYSSGDYFDNKNFYDDHIKEDIAGEW